MTDLCEFEGVQSNIEWGVTSIPLHAAILPTLLQQDLFCDDVVLEIEMEESLVGENGRVVGRRKMEYL